MSCSTSIADDYIELNVYVLSMLMINENHADYAAREQQLLRRHCYAFSLIESKQALFMYDKPLETKEY